ncbi:hypothetical protein Tco_0855426 [Tanacetum coccineum]
MTHHEILSQILRQRPYQILIQTLQSILPQVNLHRVMPYQILLVIYRLSLVHADLSPPPKRIRDSDSVTDLEVSSEDGYESYVPREVGLGVDVKDSYKPYTEPDVDSNTVAEEEVESRERDTIKVEVNPRVRLIIDDDTRESVRKDVPDHVTADGAVEVIESEQRLQGHRIIGVDLEFTTMTEWINVLEWDNTRLRGLLDVKSRRVDRLQCGMSRVQRELRQIRHFRFYDRARLGRLEAYAMRDLDEINEMIADRVDEALKAYDAIKNPRTEPELENEQQDDNVEANTGNSNGNGNGNPNVNNRGVVLVAREYTYQDLVKC